MSETADAGTEQWLNEGGHDVSDPARTDLLEQIAGARPSDLAALWSRAVVEWGDDASRIWQEALAASDASET